MSERSISQRLLALALAANLGAVGCGSSQEENFVDCEQDPNAKISTTVDTNEITTAVIGDAKENGIDELDWREKIFVDVTRVGRIAVTADGLGPVVTYENLARVGGSQDLFKNVNSGSKVTVAAVPPSSIKVTYQC